MLLTGKPNEVEQALNGRLWEIQIDRSELEQYQQDFQVISSHFHMGKMMITVIADDQPNTNFWRKAPTLEDAYFNLVMNGKRKVVAV